MSTILGVIWILIGAAWVIRAVRPPTGEVWRATVEMVSNLWLALLAVTLLPTTIPKPFDVSGYREVPETYLLIADWAMPAFLLLVTVLALYGAIVPEHGMNIGKWVGGFITQHGPLRFWGRSNQPFSWWVLIFTVSVAMCCLYGLPRLGPTLVDLAREYRFVRWLFGWYIGQEPTGLLPRYPRHWWWVMSTVISGAMVIISFVLTRRDDARRIVLGFWRKRGIVVATGETPAVTAVTTPAVVAAAVPAAVTTAPPVTATVGASPPTERRGFAYWIAHVFTDLFNNVLTEWLFKQRPGASGR